MDTDTPRLGAPRRRRASPREIVAYLLRLRPVMSDTIQLRRRFMEQVGLVIEAQRREEPVTVSRAASAVGLDHAPQFRELRHTVEALEPPAGCEPCNDAVVKWIDVHVAACGLLNEIGSRREPRRLREVQERIAEGRPHAARFNAEYARLKQEVHDRVERALLRSGRRLRRKKQGLLGWLKGA